MTIQRKIRPGYKQTEVGVIPDNWKVLQGTEITKLIGKGASPRWQGFGYTDGGMLFVTSENVRDGFLDLDKPKYLPLEFHEKIKRTKLKKGDLLINLVGASIGRSCLVDRELGEANVNQAVSVFRCAEVVLPDFVAQCFQLPATVDRILGMQVEAARPNISLGDLRRFWFIVPPIPEQHAITEALSDADALIAALEAMIAKKRDLKQAATQQLLTGKTRLPGFSGEWEVKRLGELCDVDPDNLGSGTAPSYFFKYISLEDVNKGQLLGYSELEFRFAPSRARRKLQSDDILVSTVRPNLQAHLHFKSDIEDWVCSTGFAVLRCVKDKSSSGFIFQHLFGDGINQQIEKLITGSNYPAINSREVRLLEILAPCEKEQTAIAEVLWDMDADLTALEARAAKARAVKQGMMQELLTGKVRLV